MEAFRWAGWKKWQFSVQLEVLRDLHKLVLELKTSWMTESASHQNPVLSNQWNLLSKIVFVTQGSELDHVQGLWIF